MSVVTGRLWLETRRLTLRPLRDDDLYELCLLLGDADALVLWGEALDRDGARRWIERNIARYEADGFGRCTIVLRGTGARLDRSQSALGQGNRHRGRPASRDHAFTQLALDRIVSMISEQNLASRRVAEKLGMTVERTAMWDGMPILMYACARPVPANKRGT